MRYWLFKSEPETYGIDHLKNDSVTSWSGIRNYQARNFMRDDMSVGDCVLFYHSNIKIPGIAGLAKVSKVAEPDLTQFDQKGEYYDSVATKANPRWFCVKVAFVEKFENFYSLEKIKNNQALKEMRILQKGNRLSITPVSKKEYQTIVKASGKAL